MRCQNKVFFLQMKNLLKGGVKKLSFLHPLLMIGNCSIYFLSFLQYCVQSLSVQSEHLSAILLFSQKRSGYKSTHNSQIIQITNDNVTRDHE